MSDYASRLRLVFVICIISFSSLQGVKTILNNMPDVTVFTTTYDDNYRFYDMDLEEVFRIEDGKLITQKSPIEVWLWILCGEVTNPLGPSTSICIKV